MNLISHDCHSYQHITLANGIPPRKAMVMAGENAANDVDEEVYGNDGAERHEAQEASTGHRRAIADADEAGQLDISGETKTARILRSPEPPTEAARMAHNATHVPFRDWCPFCVASRGRSSPHRRVVENKTADTLSKFQTDYMFIRTVAESKIQPCITFVETRSGVVISFMCARKGCYEDLTKEILRHFEAYGFLNPVILQSDKEMSIIDVCRKVARKRNARTALRFAPKTSHQSNGFVKAVHGHIEELARCYQTQIETNTGTQLPAISPAIPCAIRYAGCVLSRFTVRPDGRTPFQHLLGTPYVSPLCMFGESVLALIPDHEVRAAKVTNRWISGCWWERDASSDEHLVVTKHGLLKCRSVRRKPLESSGIDVTRSKLEGRSGILTWTWTLEYLDHLSLHVQMKGCQQQRHEGNFPRHIHLHLLQTVTCPRCENKGCTRKHSGSEPSGQKSAELLDARHARLPVQGSHTLANADRIKMPGRRAVEPHQRRRRNVEMLQIQIHDHWARVEVRWIPSRRGQKRPL